LPGNDKITAELNLAGGGTVRSEIHIKVVILFDTGKKCFDSASSQLMHLFEIRAIRQSVGTIKACHCQEVHTQCYTAVFCQC